jgi:hypothetical protein
MMLSQNIDCPEVVGKTVKSLKLYTADNSDAEILIEFTDGTSALLRLTQHTSLPLLKSCTV